VSKYVKFTHERTGAEIAPFDQLPALNECRRKLDELHLLGVDSNGIGFGNLSVRDGATSNFYITGSATGGLAELTLADCVRIVALDFEQNWVRYEGAAIPSSESLTHAAIYESDSNGVRCDSLSRLCFVGEASWSRSDDLAGRCLWHATNGVRNYSPVRCWRCANSKDFRHGRARRRHCRFRGGLPKRIRYSDARAKGIISLN
jgi:hypothetical protein